MTVKRVSYVTVATGHVSDVPIMDTTQGGQMTRLVPMAIDVQYHIQSGLWLFELAVITGPRVLNNGKRFTKNAQVTVRAEYLDLAPQWVRDFVAANHPSLIGAGTMHEVTP